MRVFCVCVGGSERGEEERKEEEGQEDQELRVEVLR